MTAIQASLACKSIDLCVFFAVELPWAFGSRFPGMKSHLQPVWYDRYRLLQHPNSVEIIET